MGNPGFDPGSSALQADAFIRLDYFPKYGRTMFPLRTARSLIGY